MPISGFDQWGAAAGAAADRYGLDRSLFFGLIDAESSWNPNATPGTSSAWGFGQLLKGTAKQLGVNRFDPIQNLDGSARYLSGLIRRNGLYRGVAAYHDGEGAIGQSGGFGYADKVLSKAKSYLAGGQKLLGSFGAGDALNAAVPGLGDMTDGLGVTGNCDWFCQFRNWITDSGFFQRLALAVLAFIILFAAFALMRGESVIPSGLTKGK